ncbi:urease accessory protein UreD [Pseudobacteriovorax antillogorgiicola]|uniref:Urease accessory protein n=1 Tax=Pseudobacteriovorax antillogorgiicola TaxID=1513793 RepID=A0A1Y6BD51_9BACT|nr:urease accessory protein UreD [Pseudobacteriovorax antillogorgiicola]TCS57292.1 urease accessory protein [Pseudobacteriovorax antillogorgiicola]SMF02991.1 urease accessory protein [Pseudobacteriovorax antillogorgiicola]
MIWPASLKLEYRDGNDRPRYYSRHQGPLMVQKPFWDHSSRTLHHYLLHPPGGVVGGDQLTIDVAMESRDRILVTSPSAQKVYRSDGRVAKAKTVIHHSSDGVLLWLPLETILFGDARFYNDVEIHLGPSSELMFWDILIFGRPSIGEAFDQGELVNHLKVYREGRLILNDRLAIGPESSLLKSRLGLGGKTCYGQLLAVGPSIDERFRTSTEAELDIEPWTYYEGIFQTRSIEVCPYRVRDNFASILGFHAGEENSGFEAPRIWSY